MSSLLAVRKQQKDIKLARTAEVIKSLPLALPAGGIQGSGIC